MEQRRVRLGDIVDDYCPRERRVTNHAVVAMIEDEVRQTRCTACDADHPYKAAKVPRIRKKDSLPSPAGPSARSGDHGMDGLPAEDQLADAASRVPLAEPTKEAPGPPALHGQSNGGSDGSAPTSDEGPAPVAEAQDEGPFRRPLIRATLPRPEGQPTARPLPEFTMRQSGVRGGRLIDNESRGNQRPGPPAGGPSRPRPERHGHRQDHRHGPGRSGAPHGGARFDRSHGPGRGGGHSRPGRGGKKRSR